MATQAQLTIFSPAKVNIYLRILGRRPDGFHDLETIMLPLDFGDEITLTACEKGRTLECSDPRLPTDATNLALRAANLFAQRCAIDSGVKISLKKQTPLAAGLGGGSSNAALVLTGLNQLWRASAAPAVLDELAASMGSDINFFLAGGAALCRGRGERVEPIPCRLSAAILLINPGFGIATKWAYESWAKAAAELTASAPDVSLLRRALAEDDLAGVARALYNSLEAPSVRKFPVLELLKCALRAGGAAGALMSGSGATVFGLFADAAAAESTAQRIRAEFGPSMWTRVTRFCAVAR